MNNARVDEYLESEGMVELNWKGANSQRRGLSLFNG